MHYRLGEGPYGSAYHGSIDDILSAGDLAPITIGRRTFGLFLGYFDWVQTIRHVWEQPKKGIWAWLSRSRLQRDQVERIPQVHDFRFTGDLHHLIVASTGAGKFRDVLANMLLYDGSCETSCLIIDPKGEMASTVGPALDEPGTSDPRTVILDPWNVCGTGLTHALTLLDGIRLDNPHCVKDARVLADAIIVQRGEEEGHWAETAKNFLTGLLLYLGTDHREEGSRNLRRLREIVASPWEEFACLLGVMTDSTEFGGIAARAAQAMLNRHEKERRNILSTIERDTAFIEDPNLWKAIESNSFDLNALVLSNKRLHVVVPFDYTKEMSSWLRLTIAAYYNACLRNQMDKRLPSYLRFRHIVIDEFAGLGRLDFIVKDIAEARGAGIKYHIVVQNFGQLDLHYEKGWETFVSNSFVQAFGINDQFTAEYLSKLCGQATVVTESTSTSESVSVTQGHSSGSSYSWTSAHDGGSNSSNSGTSSSTTVTTSTTQTFSTTGRAVLMPDEIRRLPADRQLLFLRGMPVLMARRSHYDDTFRALLPRHSLREVIANRSVRRLADGRSLRPYDISDAHDPSPRAIVNSQLRVTGFKAPPYRRYSFSEALRQSPGEVALAALVLVVVIFATVDHVRSSMAEAARKAEQQRAAETARAEKIRQDEAARREADQRRADAEAIDAKLLLPYAGKAGSTFSMIQQGGLCLQQPPQGDQIRFCKGVAAYKAGTLSPIALEFETRPPNPYHVRFSLAPANSKRGADMDGVQASISIITMGPRLLLKEFPETVRLALNAFLTPFAVSDAALAACMANPGQPQRSETGALFSCRLADQVTDGRQFLMTLTQSL